MKMVITIVLIFAAWEISYSQSCEEKFEQAKRAWYNGQVEQVETLLSGCLGKELDRNDRIDAYKLLVDSKLLLNEDEASALYMERLLQFDPNYLLKETDLAEFKSLYDEYEIRPKYVFGFSAGVLIPNYVILNYHSQVGSALQETEYQDISGFMASLFVRIEILRNLQVNSGLTLNSSSFRTTEDLPYLLRTVTVKETDYYLRLPLGLEYYFTSSKIRPFIGAAFGINYLLRVNAEIDNWPVPSSILVNNNAPASTSSLDISEQRQSWTYNWSVNTGIEVKVRRSTLRLDVQYQYGLSNLINESKRYSNRQLAEEFYYTPDDFKINSLTVSFGIVYPIYKAVKK